MDRTTKRQRVAQSSSNENKENKSEKQKLGNDPKEIAEQKKELDEEILNNMNSLREKEEETSRREIETLVLQSMLQDLNGPSSPISSEEIDQQKGKAPLTSAVPVGEDSESGNKLKDSENPSGKEATIQSNLEKLIAMQDENNRVKLNIGGRIFVTSKENLSRTENILKVMMETELGVDLDENGAILFEDRNPVTFPIILEHLRTGRVNKIGIDESDLNLLRELKEESDFFGTTKLSVKIDRLLEASPLPTVPAQSNITVSHPMIPTSIPKSVPKTSGENLNDKIYENFDQIRDECNEKLKGLIINQKKKIKSYFDNKEKQISEKINELEKKKSLLISKQKNGINQAIRINVSGQIFPMSLDVLTRFNMCTISRAFLKLGKLNDEIFLDANPDIFYYIWGYMITGLTDQFPVKEPYKMKQICEEAKFFNLTELLNGYFNPLRYPLEVLGDENIKMKQYEDHLRQLFVLDRNNPILDDPYINLIPVFNIVDEFQPSEPPNHIPLICDFVATDNDKNFRRNINNLKLVITDDLKSFFHNWSVFTSGVLTGLNWSNLFAAGGSVLASMLKIDQSKLKNYQNDPNDNNDVSYESDSEYDESDESDSDESHTEETNHNELIFTDSDSDSDDKSSYFSSNIFSNYGTYRRNTYKPRSNEDMCNHLIKLVHEYENLSKSVVNFSKLEQHSQIYNQSNFSGSDIDLFVYGLSEEDAEKKIEHIYSVVKKNLDDGIPLHYNNIQMNSDILIVRTEKSVTFNFQYPIRPVQIILRIYKSPAEILMGFDLDACTVGFDGSCVYALPRAKRAIKTRTNMVDVDRQSLTYELRLFKYSRRGFRIAVPGYDNEKVKNELIKYDIMLGFQWRHIRKLNIFQQLHGLVRLLLLEQSEKDGRKNLCALGLRNFRDNENKYKILENLMQLSGRKKSKDMFNPSPSESDYFDISITYLRTWNPQFSARRIESSIKFWTEKLRHKKWKPNICYSLNDLTSILFADEQKSNLSTTIKWITIDPGRQYIGSFHPTSRNFYEDAYTSIIKKFSHLANKTKEKSKKKNKIKVQWYWEVKINSWKPYDKVTTKKIEEYHREYKKGKKASTFNHAFPGYGIEFSTMKQFNMLDQTRRRRIKRETTKL